MENRSNTTVSNNRRLAKNTMFLYLRMILLMGVGLYTSRIILATLGISDYGLYNVVGGVVSMFGFLNATLATSTQRFLNFELGKRDQQLVNKVFSTALLQHLLLVVLILLVAETVGLWFVTNKLNIDAGRETAALWIYQTSILVTVVQIVQLPFMSSIIAHERMGAYAYLSIIESFLKLGIVLVLQMVSVDKLILYGCLYLLVQICIACFYIVYSYRSFSEVRFHIYYEKELFKKMLSFSSWNLFGGFSCICNTQGVNIVLNLFCGSVVNAARGIAFQVNAMVSQFVANFQLAVKPQVIKYYASGEVQHMTELVFNASKYSAFLMTIVVVPLVIEIEPILSLWLGYYPDYAPIFLSLILLRSIVASMTGNILMVVHATGHLKEVSLFSGLSYLIILPISYLMLYMGYSPIWVFIVDFLSAFADTFFELYWMRKYIQFPMWSFYRNVYGKVFPIAIVIFFLTYSVHYMFEGLNEYLRMIFVVGISIVISLLVIYYMGLNKTMRMEIRHIIVSRFHR